MRRKSNSRKSNVSKPASDQKEPELPVRGPRPHQPIGLDHQDQEQQAQGQPCQSEAHQDLDGHAVEVRGLGGVGQVEIGDGLDPLRHQIFRGAGAGAPAEQGTGGEELEPQAVEIEPNGAGGVITHHPAGGDIARTREPDSSSRSRCVPGKTRVPGISASGRSGDRKGSPRRGPSCPSGRTPRPGERSEAHRHQPETQGRAPGLGDHQDGDGEGEPQDPERPADDGAFLAAQPEPQDAIRRNSTSPTSMTETMNPRPRAA